MDYEMSRLKKMFLIFCMVCFVGQTVLATCGATFNSAPPSDIDGDTVPDCQDRCPGTPGDPSNNGCPDCSFWEIAAITAGLLAAIAAAGAFIASGGGLVAMASALGVSTSILSSYLTAAAITAALAGGFSALIAYVCNN